MPQTLYRIVSIINHKAQIVETYNLDKYDIVGTNENPNSRPELQGQPKLRGFLGPMYDGNGVVRYETQTAYNIYSQ